MIKFISYCVVLPVIVGGLIGYFLSLYVVAITTLIVGYMVYRFLRPRPNQRRTSGDLGAVFMGFPMVTCFLLSMWMTWFFAPGSVSWEFDPKPILDFLQHAILK